MIIGAFLGLLAALGLLTAIRSAPPMRPVRLADRMAPYLGDAAPQSRLLVRTSDAPGPLDVVKRLFGPLAADVVRWVDRVVGGTPSVRRRLHGLGNRLTVEQFRLEQVAWAAGGTVGAVGVSGLGGLARGGVNVVFVLAASVVGLTGGFLGRDWWLSKQLARREAAMLAEFPVVADLLALSVVAGEAPADALQRVCRLTKGEMARDLDAALAKARAGMPLTKALSELSEQTTLEPFSRFVEGLVVAIERGTPLADVLRAQAIDVREVGKRALLDAGGKKEISMMVPVIFMILPVTVLFALYPGLLTLTSLTQ